MRSAAALFVFVLIGLPWGAHAQFNNVPIISTSAAGVVTATYGYFRFISATSSNIVATDSTKVAKTGDTMTGNLLVSPGGVGYLALIQGSASNPAYVEFRTSDTTRRGYLGWANGTNLTLATENSWGQSFLTGGTERVRIAAAGGVGIGTSNPSGTLEVSGSVLATSYFHSSDRHLKKHIVPFEGGLDAIGKLRGVTFEWRSSGKPSAGVIAQEVETVLPSAVTTNGAGRKVVEYDQLVAPMIEAIKELKAANDNLKAENLSLRHDVHQIKEALRLR